MRRVSVLVAVLAFALGSLATPMNAIAQEASPVATPTASSQLDLAAMPLRPSDLAALGFPGYGRFFNGYFNSLDQLVEGDAGFLGKPADEIRALYDDIGFIRFYGSAMGRPSAPGDHESPPSGGAFVNILELDDASGGDAYLDLFGSAGPDTPWVISSAEAPFALGDRAVLYRNTNHDAEASETYDEIIVAFQVDNLIAAVGFFTFVPDAAASPVATPEADDSGMTSAAATVDALEAAGRRQLERQEAVTAGGAPNLPDLLLRVGDDPLAATADYTEGYRLLDGEIPPYYGDRDDDLSGDPAATAGADAVYELEELFRVGEDPGPDDHYLANRLYRFPDAAAATAFLDGREEALATGGTKRATGAGPATTEDLLPGEATDLGDQSLAFSFVRDFDGEQFMGYEVFVRVGSMVATVSLEGPPDQSLELVAEIAAAQADCLAAGACPDAFPVPEAFLSAVGATPVAAATPA